VNKQKWPQALGRRAMEEIFLEVIFWKSFFVNSSFWNSIL